MTPQIFFIILLIIITTLSLPILIPEDKLPHIITPKTNATTIKKALKKKKHLYTKQTLIKKYTEQKTEYHFHQPTTINLTIYNITRDELQTLHLQNTTTLEYYQIQDDIELTTKNRGTTISTITLLEDIHQIRIQITPTQEYTQIN